MEVNKKIYVELLQAVRRAETELAAVYQSTRLGIDRNIQLDAKVAYLAVVALRELLMNVIAEQ